jgi:hypothetical protein
MKPRFHLWMLKLISSQSSGCTHIYQTSLKIWSRCCLQAGKLTVTVSWYRKQLLMVEFMQQGAIMSQVYCIFETRKNCPRLAIQNRKCGMLTSGAVLLHENVHLHTATCIRALLEHFSYEMTTLLAALIPLQVTTTCLTTWKLVKSTALEQ